MTKRHGERLAHKSPEYERETSINRNAKYKADASTNTEKKKCKISPYGIISSIQFEVLTKFHADLN